MELFSSGSFAAFLQVIMIDLVLAGDNGIVIGLAAAGLPPVLRRKAILIGIIAATILRIGFAIIATQLLALTGLLLAGGFLLLWVCYKMWQELRSDQHEQAQLALAQGELPTQSNGAVGTKTLRQAVMQIVIADVSMSLDNVLAVAGAAQHHVEALVFGLGLSVLLMGAASAGIARLLHRFRWIAWVGLAVIVYVAVRMVYEGLDQVLADQLPNLPSIPIGH